MQNKWYRILLTFSLLAVLLVSSTLTAFAQDQQGLQVHITQVDNSKFPQVTVYVSVTDAAGNPVGIDPSTLQISENGQVIEIKDARGGGTATTAGTTPIPVTTMLVIDISGSMDKNNKLAAAKEAAKTYISQMRPGDQVGIMAYDTQVYSVQPVTSDTAALTAAIDSLKTGSDTAMYNAIVEAEKALSGMEGRKAIIVLTDGLDNKSQATLDDVTSGVGQSGLTVSAVGFGDAGVADQTGLDEAGLKTLAEKTGGIYSLATDINALTQFYQQYSEALQSEYALTYISSSALRDGINRNITVAVAAPSGQAVGESQYNPGGVLPEVTSHSWGLFGGLFLGLIVLLLLPFVFAWSGGLVQAAKRRDERKKEAALHNEKAKYITPITDSRGARSPSGPSVSGKTTSEKKSRIKIK